MWDYDLTNEDDPMGDAIIETHKLKDAALSAAGGGDGENEHAPLRVTPEVSGFEGTYWF